MLKIFFALFQRSYFDQGDDDDDDDDDDDGSHMKGERLTSKICNLYVPHAPVAVCVVDTQWSYTA